jgi:hypothetical protein
VVITSMGRGACVRVVVVVVEEEEVVVVVDCSRHWSWLW